MTLGVRDAEFVQEPVVGLVAPQAGKGCSANQVGWLHDVLRARGPRGSAL